MVWPEYIQSRSQDLEMIYHDAGQFYISKVEPFYQHKDFWGANTGGIILSELEVQDLDTLTGLEISRNEISIITYQIRRFFRTDAGCIRFDRCKC